MIFLWCSILLALSVSELVAVEVSNDKCKCSVQLPLSDDLQRSAVSTGLKTPLEALTMMIRDVEGSIEYIAHRVKDKCSSPTATTPGLTPDLPAISCRHVLEFDSSAPSGHYYIRDSNRYVQHVYCDMSSRLCGGTRGWMQVANFNMKNETHYCPPYLIERTYTPGSTDDWQPRRVCENDFAECCPIYYPTYNILYSEVCGKVIGYQNGMVRAFGGHLHNPRAGVSIDGNYVSGVSLTHGQHPKKHIWTFAAALTDVNITPAIQDSICPCTSTDNSGLSPPNFVKNHYFCDTGNHNQSPPSGCSEGCFMGQDPLWDGQGCSVSSGDTCCLLNKPPWFHRKLPSSISDNIEMRLCTLIKNEVVLESAEIYVN